MNCIKLLKTCLASSVEVVQEFFVLVSWHLLYLFYHQALGLVSPVFLYDLVYEKTRVNTVWLKIWSFPDV